MLAVFDAAQPLTDADLEIAHRCQNRPALAILNKEDLADSTENAAQTLQPYFKKVITLCAKEADSLQPLTDAVAELLGTASWTPEQRSCAVPASWRPPPVRRMPLPKR